MEKRLNEVLNSGGENYLLPFLWMRDGKQDKLLAELRSIYDSGARAVCLESRTHEDFCGETWWQDVDAIMALAKELGMRVWILDDKHFPTGYANGAVLKNPELRKWHLIECHADVTAPMKGALIISESDSENERAERTLVGVIAYRRAENSNLREALTGDPIDLTHLVDGRFLRWEVPEGTWRVFSIYKSREGAMRADNIHMIDENSVQLLIDAVYEPHHKRYSKDFGGTFAGFFSDEPFFGNGMFSGATPHPGTYNYKIGVPYMALPWRDDILQSLSDKISGDALVTLPLLWFPHADDTPSRCADVRVAYMDVVTSLYQKCFTHNLGDWCRERGVEYIGHVIEDGGCHTAMGHGAGHYFRALDGQDMAGIDVVLRQIMPGNGQLPHQAPCSWNIADPAFFDHMLAKLAASLAAQTPHMKGRSMCEIFGAYGWSEGVPMMKRLADHMLVRGITHFVPHAFSPDFPDGDCPPHFTAGGHNPQFAAYTKLMKYMNKLSHLLSGGKPVISAGILYHAEAEWSGEAHMPSEKVAKALSDYQIQSHYVSVDALVNATVRDKNLVVGAMEYPCLIIPYCKVLPSHALEAINKLSDAALPVIFINEPPIATTNGEKYTAPATVTICEALDSLHNIVSKDIEISQYAPLLRVLHIVRDGTHYVMLHNEEDNLFCGNIALHGNVNLLRFLGKNKSVTANANGIQVTLMPWESLILTYGGENDQHLFPTSNSVRSDKTISIDKFNIYTKSSFDDGEFELWRENSALVDMSEQSDMQDFCGYLRYEAKIDLSPAENLILDLGEVNDTARVFVNDTLCAHLITSPYIVDISDAVEMGENRIVIEVATSMGYKMGDRFSVGVMLPPCGLIGPVKLEY